MAQMRLGLMELATLATLALILSSCGEPRPQPTTTTKTCTKTMTAQQAGVAGIHPADQPIQLPMMNPADCPP